MHRCLVLLLSRFQKLFLISIIGNIAIIFLQHFDTPPHAGWGADCEEKARTYIEKYGEEMLGLLETQVQADWEYYTSISQQTQVQSPQHIVQVWPPF